MHSLVQLEVSSPMGSLYLVAAKDGLYGVHFYQQPLPLLKSLAESTCTETIRILTLAQKQLREYFNHRRTQFDLPLSMMGTEFQKTVWQELLKIPYGKTCSYSDLARRIKNDKAVRAVGTANGKNPFCIIIPCHRVIAADGSLGGYSGGLDKKEKLLALERA